MIIYCRANAIVLFGLSVIQYCNKCFLLALRQRQLGKQLDLRTILVNLPRRVKRAVVITNDLVLLSLALWLGFSLRLSVFYMPPSFNFTLLLLSAPLIGIITFHFFGIYKLVTRYIGYQGTLRVIFATSLSVLIWSLVIFMVQVPGILPRSTIGIYWILSVTFIWTCRQIAGFLLRNVGDLIVPSRARINSEDHNNVLIYGAGFSGIQLAYALAHGNNYQVVGFIDDDKTLWRQIVAGCKVYAPDDIGPVIDKYHVKEIFLALKSINRRRRREILSRLQHHPLSVKTLPAMEDIASGRVSVGDLRPVTAGDLLGRDPVPPDQDLLRDNILNKAVLITGAGGSIGSEISRQVLALRPKILVLFDLSEVALYEIEQQILQIEADVKLAHERSDVSDIVEESAKQTNGQIDVKGATFKDTIIIPVLGSVLDSKLTKKIINAHKINTIYHAAAYKHVPLVELNPVAGLNNNTFGTSEIAKVAKENNVERFVLISTDKAVRPANIMGSSKRLAEMILQAHGAQEDTNCVFTMVRFGNVLDSSGSVVRKFRKQIENGGPVTVTHKDIIRYFMSIEEAAQLVIQAGAMAKGGDVFILNMGDPVKIDNLARSMIHLAGLGLLDEQNPDGDITIQYTGLRPGEKLFEELLINDAAIETKHPLILKGNEKFLPLEKLNHELEALKSAMEHDDREQIMEILGRNVE